jgi:hypothetical protein
MNTTTAQPKAKKTKRVKPPTILGLRTCNADLTSYDGFKWPESGRVECSDWDPRPVCGGGLHFLPWGEGDGDLLNWDDDARWLVVEVEADLVVDIGGAKSKAPHCNVIYCGDRLGATDYIAKNGGHGRSIVGGTATAGNYGTATAGYKGTATASYKGTATAGNYGTATAGDEGTATASNYGTATAGNYGTATAGYKGTATASNYGTATAGDEGTIMIKRWNGKRYKFSIGYIGEDGLLPNIPYRLDGEGNFIQVK